MCLRESPVRSARSAWVSPRSASVERSVKLVDGAWTFVDATVRVNEGIGFGANLDGVAAALLDSFDGAEPLRERLPALAEALDVAEDKLEQFAERLTSFLADHIDM